MDEMKRLNTLLQLTYTHSSGISVAQVKVLGMLSCYILLDKRFVSLAAFHAQLFNICSATSAWEDGGAKIFKHFIQ